MTDSQQSQRGWFSSWREQRDAKRQETLDRARFDDQHASEHAIRRRSSAHRHGGAGAWFGGGFFGDGGGGCGGDGGGGGC